MFNLITLSLSKCAFNKNTAYEIIIELIKSLSGSIYWIPIRQLAALLWGSANKSCPQNFATALMPLASIMMITEFKEAWTMLLLSENFTALLTAWVILGKCNYSYLCLWYLFSKRSVIVLGHSSQQTKVIVYL